MGRFLFGRYSAPLVALGGLVAVACLASTWQINRLQTDLARAVRHDAAAMEAAVALQVQLRHLRVHTLVLVSDQSDVRREVVRGDLARVDDAVATLLRTVTHPDDARLVDVIVRDYGTYKDRLRLDRLPPPPGVMGDVARWSDDHHMSALLAPCQELADRQQERMNAGLARSEAESARAGQALVGLGLAGILAGLLSGYATARGLTRRVAQLFVRVQAVQAQLDQDVGAMTVEGPHHLGELDARLEEVVGRVIDVCQRLQEQERDLLRSEQLAAVGRLAAGVAHEVRNPLTGIKFLVEAALRTHNPTTLTTEDLVLIRAEIARMERTVQELLDYARTPPPVQRPHDIRELIAAAVEAARSRAERKSVAVRVELPHTPVPAAVDRDQILSLVTNLLYNAIDAAPPGGEVGVRAAARPGGGLAVAVTDTGTGIDPAIADSLFTPFATTKPTGTGLGLTVARRIARDHGGTLEAANGADGGACFTLTLPAGINPHAEAPGR